MFLTSGDTLLNLADCFIDKPNRFGAMAAFVV
jgi:hypothetical protein